MAAKDDPSRPPPRFTGLWVDDDGSVRRETTYVDGVPHGPFRIIARTGVAIREGEHYEGRYHGVMTIRSRAGNELDRATFEHGTGLYRIFTTDERLAWEIPLVRGAKHGTVRRLHQDEWLDEEWRDGVLLSTDQKEPGGPR